MAWRGVCHGRAEVVAWALRIIEHAPATTARALPPIAIYQSHAEASLQIVKCCSYVNLYTMKQRVTYLLHESGGIDPATLDITKDSLKLPGIKAAKEWRITLGTRELPQEV